MFVVIPFAFDAGGGVGGVGPVGSPPVLVFRFSFWVLAVGWLLGGYAAVYDEFAAGDVGGFVGG